MILSLAKAIAKGDDDYERDLLEEMLDLERDRSIDCACSVEELKRRVGEVNWL